MFPNDLLYTERHHWVRPEDTKRVKIGLTAYAEHRMGTVTFFRFPEPGRNIELGGELCVLNRRITREHEFPRANLVDWS